MTQWWCPVFFFYSSWIHFTWANYVIVCEYLSSQKLQNVPMEMSWKCVSVRFRRQLKQPLKWRHEDHFKWGCVNVLVQCFFFHFKLNHECVVENSINKCKPNNNQWTQKKKYHSRSCMILFTYNFEVKTIARIKYFVKTENLVDKTIIFCMKIN